MPVILEINDSALTVRRDGEQLAVEPGFARYRDNDILAVGKEAARDARRHPRQNCNDHWYRLSTEPLPNSGLTRADLVNRQLQSLLSSDAIVDDTIVLIVPGSMSSAALSLLLGICSANGRQVTGIIDAAVAATATRYPDQTLVHVHLSLHAAVVSQLHQTDTTVALTDVRSLDDNGLHALNELWLKFFAQQFVRQCRFDPLHSADTEQALGDKLTEWLDAVERAEESRLTMTHAGQQHDIVVQRVDVINAVASTYQRISDMARAALGGGRNPALQLSRTVANLPGFSAFLTARSGGKVYVIEDDAALRNVESNLASVTGGGSQLQKQFPLSGLVREAGGPSNASVSAQAPTHVVHDASVIALGGQPLVIGAAVSPDRPRMLVLDGQPPGVSGMHCEIRSDGQQVLVNDMSRYGTFLNGNRVSGSAVLAAGDLLRVGTPGIELRLVREVTPS